MLLSATVPPPVQRLARRYMRDPESMDFSPKEIAGDTIEQFYFTVDQNRKFDLLVKLLDREDPQQAIVFCRTKRGTDRLASRLTKRRRSVDCIHGDLPQRTRDRVMARFRDGKVRVLIATDVVGRGIDVTGISHIINYDVPQFCDDYIHRVGRTGRMSKEGISEGVAYTFVTPEQGSELTRIEMRINKLLVRDEIEGFETVSSGPAPPEAPVAPEPDEPPRQPPPQIRPGGRPRRRIRRAL
jgi:ATP-dependent RNA helicase DeaD